jgi:hypothetical protein
MAVLIIYFAERWIGKGFVCFSNFDELLLRGVIAPNNESRLDSIELNKVIIEKALYGFLSG